MLSSPILLFPPSITAGIILPNSLITSEEFVVLILPERFADGAAMGIPQSLIKSNAILFEGILTPTVPKPEVAKDDRSVCFFNLHTRVRGPGQKASANCKAKLFKFTYSSTKAKSEKWIISGLNFGLSLDLKIPATAKLFRASAPKP